MTSSERAIDPIAQRVAKAASAAFPLRTGVAGTAGHGYRQASPFALCTCLDTRTYGHITPQQGWDCREWEVSWPAAHGFDTPQAADMRLGLHHGALDR